MMCQFTNLPITTHLIYTKDLFTEKSLFIENKGQYNECKQTTYTSKKVKNFK